MDFLTENDIRYCAVASFGSPVRILLAVPDAASVIRVLEHTPAGLVVPQELAPIGGRMPGPKHQDARFEWMEMGGRERLRLYYGSRETGVSGEPFRLTFQDLPFERPAYVTIHRELVRVRQIIEQAGQALDKALP